MGWQAIVAVLLELFGPFLRRLLERLLNRARARLEAERVPAAASAESIRVLFARARVLTWSRRTRRALAKCEEIALAEQSRVFAALAGGPMPALTLTQQVELAELL